MATAGDCTFDIGEINRLIYGESPVCQLFLKHGLTQSMSYLRQELMDSRQLRKKPVLRIWANKSY